MKVELDTLICPIITLDTYSTGFQNDIREDCWEEFTAGMVKIGADYIKNIIKETKIFSGCAVTVDPELHSPKFYNYGTDWIDFTVDISSDIIDNLSNIISPDFYTYIKKFGSHSGFISNYPTTEKEVELVISKKDRKFPLLIAMLILWEVEKEINLDNYQDAYISDVWEYASSNGMEVDEEDMDMAESNNSNTVKGKAKMVVNNILEGKTLTEALKLTESIDNDKIQALLQFLDLDVDDDDNWNKVSVAPYDDNRYWFDGNRNEFLICTDDEADEEFHDSFMNLVDDLGLESFSPHARDYILANFCDEDVINDYYQDDVRNYAEDIQDDSESPKTITVEDDDGEDVDIEVTNRLFQECLEHDLLDLDDFKASDFNEDGDYIGDEDLVEIYCDYFDSPEKQGYDDGYDWLKWNFGEDYANKFISDNDAIDWDQVAEYIKDEDGRGNELASYDGEENEEEVNGTTYYIYKINYNLD